MSATHWLTNSWNLNALAFSKYLVSLPKLLPAFHSYQNWHQLQAVKAVNIFKQLSKLSTACFSCTIQIYRPFGNGEGKNWKMQWWMCRLLKTPGREIFHGFWYLNLEDTLNLVLFFILKFWFRFYKLDFSTFFFAYFRRKYVLSVTP